MGRYEVDKVLWEVTRKPGVLTAFMRDAEQLLIDRDLEVMEKDALLAKDARALFLMGAHPFLIYSFSIATGEGWSFAFMERYVESLEGVPIVDIET